MEYGEQRNLHSRLYKTSDLKCLIKGDISNQILHIWSTVAAMEEKFEQSIEFKE